MTENQRESFRIDADEELHAELFHEGRVAPCTLQNLSAGGARLRSKLEMPPGTQCTLGVRLGGAGHGPNGRYVSFLLGVLDATPKGDWFEYRLQSLTAPGSAEHEAATRLVFEAQRRRLAASSGTDQASPMASDEQRRKELRTEQRQRFSKGSLRPDSDR